MDGIERGEVLLNGNVIGVLGRDNKVQYDHQAIKEIIAGQAGTKSFKATGVVTYRYSRTRKADSDDMYSMWKENPIMQNRIIQLNSLVFGRGLKWTYDDNTQAIVDRFWRINKLRSKLDAIGVNTQLYGEVYFGLFPQKSGDVLVGIYESNQVDIDFDPGNVYNVNKYIITYKDEDKGIDQTMDMMPIDKYLNNIELTNSVTNGVVGKVRKMLGLGGVAKIDGKGVMAHIKFNNATSDVYGDSDFKQAAPYLNKYMDFVDDRLTIHQMYGSPAYDITIDTDDPKDITDRIDELDGFEIGSNPVHNSKETWKPLQFTSGGIPVDGDEKMMRGLICAGTGFPEYLLFNQNEAVDADNTFALQKIAEDRQAAYNDLFTDLHKFAVSIAGGDITLVDKGQVIFPEISTMPEKAKSESYVLKVGANICSRKTAATNLGYDWEIEEDQMMAEKQEMGNLMDNTDIAGAVGGRFNSRMNSGKPGSDDGSDHKIDRLAANNTTTQVIGDRLKSD